MVQGENPVSDAGVLALGRALEVNKTLQYLNLVSCRVVVFVALFAGDASSLYLFWFFSVAFLCMFLFRHCSSRMSQSQRDSWSELWSSHRLHRIPDVSVEALCRFVACILPKDTFFEVSFRKFRVRIPVSERDNPPVSACVGCDSWLREGLAIPPRNVVLEGWSAVLGYLRTVSEYCRCFLKSSCTTRVSSNFLKRCTA